MATITNKTENEKKLWLTADNNTATKTAAVKVRVRRVLKCSAIFKLKIPILKPGLAYYSLIFTAS